MPSISIDTERMAVSNTKINKSLSDMPTTTGVKESETGPHREQCHQEPEKVHEITHHTEGEIALRDALYPTMRVISDSEIQPTHHSRKPGMYERAVKGVVMVKTNTKGENNTVERHGDVTIKIEQRRLTVRISEPCSTRGWGSKG